MKYSRRDALKVLAGMTAILGASVIKRLTQPPPLVKGEGMDYPYQHYFPFVI